MKIWNYAIGIEVVYSFTYGNKFQGTKTISPGRYVFFPYEEGGFIFANGFIIDHKIIPIWKYKYVFL